MFYTSVNRKDNKIYIRGYKDGKSFKKSISYNPYLFIKSQKETGYKTIFNENVERKEFSSIKESRNFIQKYNDLPSYKIYGMREFEFTYIYDNFPKGFEYNFNQIKIIDLDIENDSEGGFANIDEADREITAITLSDRGKNVVTLGLKPWDNPNYILCENETDMLERFLDLWNSEIWRPDIVSGWNIKLYDIPYLVNRISRVLGEEATLRMSPWREIRSVETEQKTGKKFKTYTLMGISIIDYYEAYKKYATSERESYTLDFISEFELKDKKTDYKSMGYRSLDDLYKRNPALYYEYNQKDTVLVSRLEERLHYIEQIVTIAYLIGVNFENVLKTVKPWDVLIHNYLMNQNIVIEPMPEQDEEESEQIIGGYVKEPIPGYYKWICSLDFTSLYPSIAMMMNISPETLVVQLEKHVNLEKVLHNDIAETTSQLVLRNQSMTSNGCLFKREKRGFIPAIMKEFFDERKVVKKKMLDLEKKLEELKKNGISSEQDKLKGEIRQLDNLQTAFKLLNNSGYGAIANPYMRWFSNALAEGITATGQMVSQYVAFHLNKYLNNYFDLDLDWIVYQDTDSAYINLEPLINKINPKNPDIALKACIKFMQERVRPEVARICEEFSHKFNAFDDKVIEMKFETATDKAIFIRKKRYILNILWKEGTFLSKPKVKVTGLESQRSSVPRVARDVMIECFNLMFKEDKEGLIARIEEFKKEFFKMTFVQIGKPSSVKGLEKYFDSASLYRKATPIHVRGSLIFNSFLEKKGLVNLYERIYNHDKIRYCYLKKENPTKENVIAVKGDPPPELELDKYIDYDTQWEKIFFEPMNNICKAIGWNVEKIYAIDDMFRP